MVLPIVILSLLIIIDVRFLQMINVWLFIAVTELGIFAVFKLGQSLKVHVSIEATTSGRFTEINSKHSEKALF